MAAAGIALPPLRFIGLSSRGSVRGLWAFPARADELEPWWRRLRGVHGATGWWPVILGPDAELTEIWDTGEDPDDVVAAGLAMDPVGRLAELRADMTAEHEEWSESEEVWPPRGDVGAAGFRRSISTSPRRTAGSA